MPEECRKNAGRMPEECRKNAGGMPEECRKNAGRMLEECRRNAGGMPEECCIKRERLRRRHGARALLPRLIRRACEGAPHPAKILGAAQAQVCARRTARQRRTAAWSAGGQRESRRRAHRIGEPKSRRCAGDARFVVKWKDGGRGGTSKHAGQRAKSMDACCRLSWSVVCCAGAGARGLLKPRMTSG